MTDDPAGQMRDDAPALNSVPAVARTRWTELVREIERARDAYYVAVDAQSPWSDAEYDAMYRELEALEAAHPALVLPDSPTRTVGGRAATDFAEVQHHEHLSPCRMSSASRGREWSSASWRRPSCPILSCP